MSTGRTTLALPVDTVRQWDDTITQTQLTNNTVVGSQDDVDTIKSDIEDAEDEFRQATDATMRLSRAGVPGDRTTFEQATYKLSGHKTTKWRFTGTISDFNPTEKAIELANERVLPFDSADDDQIFIYNGLGTSTAWEDVTDEQGEVWDILDHRGGTLVFDPTTYYDQILGDVGGVGGTLPTHLRRVRFAISYRYGVQGGDRGYAGQTTLDGTLAQGATTTVGVADAGRLPTAAGDSVVLLVGDEYLRATVDAGTDQIDVVQRGVRGTSDVAHSSGDRVQYTPGAVRKAVAARAGMQMLQSGRYTGFLPDADDSMDRGDVLDELRDIWTTTTEALG